MSTWNESIVSPTQAFWQVAWLIFLVRAWNQRLDQSRVVSAAFTPPSTAPTLSASGTGGTIGVVADPSSAPTLTAQSTGGGIGAATVSVSFTWLYRVIGQVVETLPSPSATYTFSSGSQNAVLVTMPNWPSLPSGDGTSFALTGPYAVRVYASTTGSNTLATFIPHISGGPNPPTYLLGFIPGPSLPAPPSSTGLTIYVRYTWLLAAGGETLPSPAASIVVSTGQTNQITVTVPTLPAGAALANIFAGCMPGGETSVASTSGTTAAFTDLGLYSNPTSPEPVPTQDTTATNVQSTETPFFGGLQGAITTSLGYTGASEVVWVNPSNPITAASMFGFNTWDEPTLRANAQPTPLSTATYRTIGWISFSRRPDDGATVTLAPGTGGGSNVVVTFSGGTITDNAGSTAGTYGSTGQSAGQGLLNFMGASSIYAALTCAVDLMAGNYQVTARAADRSVFSGITALAGHGVSSFGLSSIQGYDPAIGNGWWNRNRARVVGFPDDTLDDQGNEVATGQIALVSSSLALGVCGQCVAAITDPASAPTATGSSTGGFLPAGAYSVTCAVWNGIGTTNQSPAVSVTIADLAATGTLKFAGLVAGGDSITLVSNPYNFVLTFAVGPGSSVTLTDNYALINQTFTQTTAADVQSAVLTALGNATYAGQISASSSGNTINLTQVAVGSAGNQPIGVRSAAISGTGFAGGTTATGSIAVTIPGTMPTNGKFWAVSLDGANTELTTSTTITLQRTRTKSVFSPRNWTQWIPVNAEPDSLSSANAPSAANHLDPGIQVAGDYITPAILIELRAMLNGMVWAKAPAYQTGGAIGLPIVSGSVTVPDVLGAGLTVTADLYVTPSGSAFNWTYYSTLGPGVPPLTGSVPSGQIVIAVVKYDGSGGFSETISSP
jgi:hypothetical protein